MINQRYAEQLSFLRYDVKVSIQAYKLYDYTVLLSEKIVVKFWSYILVYCFLANTYKINKHCFEIASRHCRVDM
jgi:hypothetical protein